MDPSSPDEPSGSWDSIHVFETAERGRQAHYKLTSTVMLQLVTRRTEDTQTHAVAIQEKKPSNYSSKSLGEVNLSGSMTRQVICKNFELLNPNFSDSLRLLRSRRSKTGPCRILRRILPIQDG
jgi:hypothetical protein